MATKTEYKQAIDSSNGTKIDIARRLDVSPSAVTQYMQKNEDIAKLLENKRLDNIDLAEAEIFEQLNFHAGDNAASAANIRQKASQFLLTRLGKNSGWVEKTEQAIEHSGDNQLKVIIERVEPDGDKTKT